MIDEERITTVLIMPALKRSYSGMCLSLDSLIRHKSMAP